ncbi:hypothetical protein C9439_00085 [archaeon SCG-AAA382B04]|nr:hypothetical protein C9439_00085 [archaeon SCG-AAA382B04]
MINDIYDKVLKIVENWCPSKSYSHERRFQNELRDYLSERLNSPNQGFGGLQKKRNIPVETEKGREIKADILVDETVPIEVKRNLKRRHYRGLDSELSDYLKEFNQVILVICGVEREQILEKIKSKWESTRPGLSPTQGKVDVVVKRKENFGKGNDKEDDKSGWSLL